MTGMIALIVNWITWIALSIILMLRFISLASYLCKFLNKSYRCFSQTGNVQRDSIHFMHKLFACIAIFGIPVTVVTFYGLTPIVFILIVPCYFLVSQFLVGHMYEWTLLERFKKAFVRLRVDFKFNINHRLLRRYLMTHLDYVDLLKGARKLFEWNKVAGNIGFLIILSFYWFYSFEYIFAKSVIKQVTLFYYNKTIFA